MIQEKHIEGKMQKKKYFQEKTPTNIHPHLETYFIISYHMS